MSFSNLFYGKKLIAFIFFVPITLVFSQELYVSQPLGSDSNSGSESSPFKPLP